MANVKNKTDEPLEVRPLNRTVEPGQTVDVSDYLLVDHAWPAATWEITGTDVVKLVGDAYVAPPPEPAPPEFEPTPELVAAAELDAVEGE